eukprot:235344-Alexandrium_andersonii.AAC.1
MAAAEKPSAAPRQIPSVLRLTSKPKRLADGPRRGPVHKPSTVASRLGLLNPRADEPDIA